MRFTTTVSGIPCQCVVTDFTQSKPARITNLPEHSYEEEPTEIEFSLLDRKGYPAKWLERKLTDDDEQRLIQEYLECRRNLH